MKAGGREKRVNTRERMWRKYEMRVKALFVAAVSARLRATISVALENNASS